MADMISAWPTQLRQQDPRSAMLADYLAFAAVGGAAGVLAIVDGIGTLVSLATSPRTDEVVGRIRQQRASGTTR